MKFRLLLMLLGWLAFAACKTTRTVSRPQAVEDSGMTKEKVLEGIRQNRFEFENIVIRGKAEADSPAEGKQSFTYKITMARDSLVLISVSKFGIEALRLLARPDSVFARFALEHRAVVSDFSYLTEKMGMPLSFAMLQDIIVGNAVFLTDSLNFDSNTGPLYRLNAHAGGTHLVYGIGSDDFRLKSLKGEDRLKDFSSHIEFSAFNPTGNRTMPWQAEMTVEKPQKFSLKFEHSKVEASEEVPDFNFQIPPSYEIEYAGNKRH